MISQAETAGPVYHLLYDGHGSTRALLDASGNVLQRYAYDAYGNMLVGVGLTSAANAATRLLYSGEQTDKATGLQYLRARYYDPRIGRFNRLDPFAGNTQDPLSLHKYLYTHGDPVQGVDPSGLTFSLSGSIITSAIGTSLQGLSAGAVIGAGFGAIDVLLAGKNVREGALAGLAFGAGFGAVAPFFPLLLTQGLIVGFTTVGVADSLSNGHEIQALFRLGAGIMFFRLSGQGTRRVIADEVTPANVVGSVGKAAGNRGSSTHRRSDRP